MYSTVNGFHKAVRADGRGRDGQASHPGGVQCSKFTTCFFMP